MSGLWRIGKRFPFEATREVGGRFDGRTFTAEVVLASETLSSPGFVVDFGVLSPVKKYIGAVLDHQLLNEVVPDPSDDGLAQHLTTWARNHLPPEACSVLQRVRIHTGRPASLPARTAVDFDASHRLDGLPPDHQCARLHGHSYRVILPAEEPAWPAPANMPPFFADYLVGDVDGRLLNDVFAFNPTCEHLAAYFARWLHERDVTGPDGCPVTVRVSETESTWGEYQGRPE
ncbi:6-carboxytetrahydropterin synthase [Streptomyces sp. NPDC046862]|uniref:6-pyruvoyl trahydropterin synthase family protein n=1 Tax=Streptomyces sp. NPDC046862 TaxID=3154603 RepID=UPI0034524167